MPVPVRVMLGLRSGTCRGALAPRSWLCTGWGTNSSTSPPLGRGTESAQHKAFNILILLSRVHSAEQQHAGGPSPFVAGVKDGCFPSVIREDSECK